MSFDNTPKLSPESIDLIIGSLDAKEDLAILKTTSLANKRLRDISQSRIFTHVDLLYLVEWKKIQLGGDQIHTQEPVVSLVDAFLNLLQTSPRIASYVRSLSFIFDTGGNPSRLSIEKGLAAAASVVALTKNLTNIWFPITNEFRHNDSFPEWSQIPEDLRTAFLQLYQKPPSKDNERRCINIEGIRKFPADILLTIPRISELSVMPLVYEAWVEQMKNPAGITIRETYSLRSLKLYYYSQEHTALHWVDVMKLLDLRSIGGRSAFSLNELLDLDIVCTVDEIPEFLIMMGMHPSTMSPPLPIPYTPVIFKACNQTLKNLTLRLPNHDSFYSSKAWGVSRVVNPPGSEVQMDLSGLSALQSLSIHFSIDQAIDEEDDYDRPLYKTHVPFVGNLLKSIVKSPAFSRSRTLSSITFTVSLGKWCGDEGGHFPTSYNMGKVDWSDITRVLTSKFSESRLKLIKFKFLVHSGFEDCSSLNEAELKTMYNTQLKKLHSSTGIVVVE
ncbi:hypothetical protein CVT24_001659 [Panaeolus cyanescens]|uniref:Uncharacterized protein n=1 Tax=Panaeolus cyanescens TaxID=181874 RepID=A0A409VSX1_9AGAR|nr:hypothetical protein CVT24_001659 [Panaeolus cyanescens]